MNYIFIQNTVLFLALVAAFAFQGTAHIYAQNSEANYLVVGAALDYDTWEYKGGVYIFEKDSSGVWSKTLKISDNGGDGTNGELGVDLDSDDNFGSSSAIDGNTLVVGATGDDDGAGRAGAVYIFEKDSSGAWSQTLKISDNGGDGTNGELGVDLDRFDHFGRSSAIDGDTLVVGTYRDSDGHALAGAVYIFEKDSSGVWGQTLKISDNGGDGTNGELGIDLDAFDVFGVSSAIDGNTLVVGADRDEDGNTWGEGAVYIFDRDSSGAWSETLKISDNGGDGTNGELGIELDENGRFGRSSAIDGNTLVVGASGDSDGGTDIYSNKGAVYIFEKDSSGVWSKTLKISDNGGDGTNGELGIDLDDVDAFGHSSTVYGNTLAVGAVGSYNHDGDEAPPAAYNSGATYIFEKDSSGVWSKTLKISDNGGDGTNGELGVDLDNEDHFGYSSSLSNISNSNPYSIALAADDDTGVKGDGVTENKDDLTFRGRSIANSTVQLFYKNSAAWTQYQMTPSPATTTVNWDGEWEITASFSENAAANVKAIGFRTTQTNGTVTDTFFDDTVSQPRPGSMLLTIDYTAPSPFSIALAADDDTGVKGDGVTTNKDNLTFSGKSFENSTVELFYKNSDTWTKYQMTPSPATTTVNWDGEWEITASFSEFAAGNVKAIGFRTTQTNGTVTNTFFDDAVSQPRPGSMLLTINYTAHIYAQNSEANYLVVGAPRDGDGGPNRGAVYIFEKDSSGVWSETLKISDNGGDGTNGELGVDLNDGVTFGLSSAIDGNTLVVGAYGDDDVWSHKGAVYIFEKDSSGVWSETLKISDNGGDGTNGELGVDLDRKDYFGRSSAIDGNTLVVGANADGKYNRGAIYIFEKDSSGVWSKTLKISDNGGDGTNGELGVDLDGYDFFGRSSAIDGNTLVVGAHGDEDGGYDKGAVYIFEKDSSGAWSETLKISDNGGDGTNGELDINLFRYARFGTASAIDDNTLVVGALGDHDGAYYSGAIYIFEKDLSGAWSETLKISDNGGDGTNGELGVDLDRKDYFGRSSAIDGNTLVVGASGDGDGGADKGAVYIFEKDSSGVWSETLKISDNGGDGTNGELGVGLDRYDGLGYSSSLSNISNSNPYSIALAADDDTGARGDGVTTNKDELTFSGRSIANATVELFYKNSDAWTKYQMTPSPATTTVDANGHWSITVSFSEDAAVNVKAIAFRTTQTDGTITDTFFDDAVNQPRAGSMLLTINYTAPSKYSIALAENDDTGTVGDGVTTNKDELTFSGRSVPNAIVELFYKNSTTWTKYQMTPSPATTTADEDGNWETTVSFSEFAAGNVKAIAFRTTQTDGTITDTFFDDAVNQPRTGSMLLTINYQADYWHSIGFSDFDTIGERGDGVTTKKDNLSFYGKRSFPGSKVEFFYYDGNVWTQKGLTSSTLITTTNEGGVWIIDDVSFTESAAENVTRVGVITELLDGTFEYPFPENSSSSMDLVINYTAPSYSIALAADDDTGIVGDGVTDNKDNLTFNGTSVPTATVELFYKNSDAWTKYQMTPSPATTTVNWDGNWEITASFSEFAAGNVTRVGIRTTHNGEITNPYASNSPSSMGLTINYIAP